MSAYEDLIASLEDAGIVISPKGTLPEIESQIMLIDTESLSIVLDEWVSIGEVLALMGLEEVPDYAAMLSRHTTLMMVMPEIAMKGGYYWLYQDVDTGMVVPPKDMSGDTPDHIPDIKPVPQHQQWNLHSTRPGRSQARQRFRQKSSRRK